VTDVCHCDLGLTCCSKQVQLRGPDRTLTAYTSLGRNNRCQSGHTAEQSMKGIHREPLTGMFRLFAATDPLQDTARDTACVEARDTAAQIHQCAGTVVDRHG
jgi:hypothetical protein